MTDVGHHNVPVRDRPVFSGYKPRVIRPRRPGLGDSPGSDKSRHPPYRFQIITGNATASRNEFFSSRQTEVSAWSQDGVEFSSTVIPTRTTLA